MEQETGISGGLGSAARLETDAVPPVVLIVDDERDLADTYARWLESEYDVRTAYGGHEAIEQLDESVDVVLLDRRMPRITGDEVLEHLREQGYDCRVSMLTAVEPDSDLTELRFDEYLVKPVTRADLVDVVNELLLRGSLTEDTQEYLALRSTADTMSEHGGEGGPDPETVADVQERVQEAAEDPTVQRESAELDRLKTLTRMMRSVNRAVVDVDSRAELDERVCEGFVEVDPYAHTVAGECTAAADEFIPTATCEGDPDVGPLVSDGGVVGAALDECEVRVTEAEAVSDTPTERLWTESEAAPEPAAVVTVPVAYRETVLGAVVLLADEQVELSDRERAVLAEIGSTVGNALDSLRTEELVHTDRIVEVELDVADRDDVFVDLAAEYDCRVALEGLNRSSSDGIACYLTVTTDRSDDVIEFLATRDAVGHCRTVDDRGDDLLVECAVRSDAVLLSLLDASGNVTEFRANRGRGRVRLEMPPSRDLHRVFDRLREEFDGVDLVSKRTADRSYQSIEGFRASLRTELTDRQNAALEAAFHAGYFDWPRESTAEEVAEGLGIAPPTFHEHLREAERKLADIYFDETE
jgi:predicted DNA binding protein/CheY-like chemotaxis protein